MPTATMTLPGAETLAELLDRLGGIPPERVRMRPAPGTATKRDVVAARESPERTLCELVDGTLVEKAVGAKESLLAVVIIQYLGSYVEENDLGVVLGPDGAMRLLPGLVRIPDVSFISWERLPGHEFPEEPIPDLVPDLAVEVLSKTNTKREMERKLLEYFEVGVRLAWLIYPRTQTAEIFTAPKVVKTIGKNQKLDGGVVLPGFSLALRKLFERTRKRRGR